MKNFNNLDSKAKNKGKIFVNRPSNNDKNQNTQE
jgi:hypothetical protein